MSREKHQVFEKCEEWGIKLNNWSCAEVQFSTSKFTGAGWTAEELGINSHRQGGGGKLYMKV